MRGDVGSVAVRHRGRLERAAGLVEGAPQRRRPGRPARGSAGPCGPRPPGRRAPRGRARPGSRSPGSTIAQSSGRPAAALTATTDGTRERLGSSTGSSAESSSSKSSTATRPSIPNGCSRPRRSSSPSWPPSASARTSPASRRSVSRTARSRIISRPTTIAACRASSRSRSPIGPLRRASDQPVPSGCRCRRAGTGTATARPASAAALGDEHRLAAGLGALVDLGRGLSDAARCEKPPLLRVAGELDAAVVEQHRRPRDRVGDRPHDLGKPALGEHEALEQRVDLDAALERLIALVDQPRRRPLGDRDERQLEGQLEQRQPARLAPLRSAPAAARRDRGRRRARARPRPCRRAGGRTCAAGRRVFRLMPVVSSSSPPDRNGVGSSSSEMWTQRIGASGDALDGEVEVELVEEAADGEHRFREGRCPGRRDYSAVTFSQASSSTERRTVADLLELLAAAGQRRSELDDGIATIVGAADQPAPVELTGEEAAQQPLRLVVVEALERLAVLDQLDRVEVARPADVADDRDVAQVLERLRGTPPRWRRTCPQRSSSANTSRLRARPPRRPDGRRRSSRARTMRCRSRTARRPPRSRSSRPSACRRRSAPSPS